MVDLTTTATAGRKIPTEATPLIAVHRVITLTVAVRGALADLTITILALMADRRNAAVVRGCDFRVHDVC